MSYSVDTTIQNCYNIGMIAGKYNVGGIVASASTSKALYATDCYSHGTIKELCWGMYLRQERKPSDLMIFSSHDFSSDVL